MELDVMGERVTAQNTNHLVRGGIGNRINSLINAMVWQEALGAPVTCYWVRHKDCRATFEELFAPIPELPNIKDCWERHHYPARAAYTHQPQFCHQVRKYRLRMLPGLGDYPDRYAHFFKKIVPSPFVAAFRDKFIERARGSIALQFRLNIRGRETLPKAAELLRLSEGDRLLICGDHAVERDRLMGVYGDRAWHTGLTLGLADMDCRSALDIQYAYAEMLLLAETRLMYTASPWESSFTQPIIYGAKRPYMRLVIR